VASESPTTPSTSRPSWATAFYNGGPAGVEGNPIGNNSSQTLTLNGFTLPTDGSLIAWPTNTNFNLFSVSQNFKTPYLYNYSLNVQKSLGRAAIAQVGYVGSLGRHLLLLRDINQAALGMRFDLSSGQRPTRRGRIIRSFNRSV